MTDRRSLAPFSRPIADAPLRDEGVGDATKTILAPVVGQGPTRQKVGGLEEAIRGGVPEPNLHDARAAIGGSATRERAAHPRGSLPGSLAIDDEARAGETGPEILQASAGKRALQLDGQQARRERLTLPPDTAAKGHRLPGEDGQGGKPYVGSIARPTELMRRMKSVPPPDTVQGSLDAPGLPAIDAQQADRECGGGARRSTRVSGFIGEVEVHGGKVAGPAAFSRQVNTRRGLPSR